MAPGILAITLFADRVAAFIRKPHWGNFAVVAGLALIIALGSIWIKKRFLPKKRQDQEAVKKETE
jgi:hypothetical protein